MNQEISHSRQLAELKWGRAMKRPLILLFHGKGVISRIIRWQTRSYYSHAAIIFPDGVVYEAWQGSARKFYRNSGVRKTVLTSTEGVDAFDIPGVTDSQYLKLRTCLNEEVGQKYDYISVLRFLTRREPHNNRKWFCSELIVHFLLRVGVRILNLEPSKVSPGQIKWSPLVRKIKCVTQKQG